MKRITMLLGAGILFLCSMVYAAVPQLINFQGILRDGSGNPVADGSYSVQFTIYDAPSGGTNLWTETQSVNTVNGLFSVLLGSGPTPLDYSIFNDSTRWLGVKVGADPEMTPRQRLSSVGYSHNSSEWTSAAQDLFRLNGNVGIGTTNPGAKLSIVHSGFPSYTGLSCSTSTSGVSSIATAGYFYASQTAGGSPPYGYGVYAVGSGFGTTGVYGTGGDVGVYGSGGYTGVFGEGQFSATGVYGKSSTGNGVQGDGDVGVLGTGNSFGVWGSTSSGWAVYGNSFSGYGAYGRSSSNYGVYGYSSGNYGVVGEGNSGVLGIGSPGGAGIFIGNVSVFGNLSKSTGSFKIDHPLDPANKYLYHSFVESPDMMNIYNGNVTLDSKGEATLELPDWFGVLNSDFRYQLTAIGTPGPNLYVAQEVSGNQFRIAGGTAGMKVSWQVTGIRQDAYASAHRIQVEEDKPEAERGKYLHPKELGVSEALGIQYEMTQKLKVERRQQEEQRAKMEQERKLHEEQRDKMEQERLIQEQKIKEKK